MHPAVQKIVIRLRAEKKQAVILAVLTIAALGLWARGAATSNSQAAAASSGAQTTQPAETDAPASREREIVAAPAAPPLSRDLFLPRAEDFARPPQTEPARAVEAKSARNHDDNMPDPQTLPRVTLEEQVREHASRLTLRSTVVGTDPIAVIETDDSAQTERVVLRVGESAFGFTLRDVRHRTATLEKDGVMVRLTIPLH